MVDVFGGTACSRGGMGLANGPPLPLTSPKLGEAKTSTRVGVGVKV